ncbi:Trs120-domain-containing protein [Pseudovirgaria hyperparasitica]|uniref:Trs120-domain-containing protein n=1 Tax=Pseudovirgaria hyperparasitica TaxID=470096 RepID=A0A6A6W2T4_9PEZI|nr:Trs120-domain-containing protein [Pseudovirgaria hyperparasitica]KAF2756270.1 Trs120-domain-containing protein [Pseudovirgaria hyperparasitica]
MAVDPLSPIAPARIRALLLPAGRIKRKTFAHFVQALQSECNVRLGDVSPDFTPNRNLFSPLAFPSGMLLYDLATTLPTPSQLALSPFELFREPFVILGIADASEHEKLFESSKSSESDSSHPEFESPLYDAVYRVREQFPNALVHQLLVFNYERVSRHWSLPDEATTVPPQARWKTTTLKTIMCDLSSLLLAEMTAFARSLQALPTIPSPSSPESLTAEGNPSNTKTVPLDASRRNSQMAPSTRPDSSTTPTPTGLYRMSMPPKMPSSVPGSSPLSPSSEPRSPPAKTFDEIPGVNIAEVVAKSSSTSSKSKPASESRNSSQDRVSVHGFGPGGVLERARNKGIGRVGLTVGSLYLCAGLWPDALRELTEHANNAKNLSDHLWHAKGLENILVCLILLAWRRVDFQIPQICYPNPEKTINLPNIRSPHHTPSNSITSISGGSPRSSFQIAAIQKLNAAIPDLITMILSIYGRASNFSGEAMPFKAHSECIIRLSKYLAMSHIAGGSLTDRALESIVCDKSYASKSNMNISRITISPTKNDIAAMVLRAVPLPTELANMSIADGSIILTGIASVLSTLRLDRKRALVMKELIAFMIPAIVQARKIGAAEMGVHPAAGLGLMGGGGGGANDGTRLGASDPDTGLIEFLNLLGRIYGVSHGTQTSNIPLRGPNGDQVNGTAVPPSSTDNQGRRRSSVVLERIQNRALIHDFGNLNLKLDILRMCINFCEALPDLKGVMHFTAALLRAAGPGNAPRPDSPDVYVNLAKDEQLRHAATISRTTSTARKLGLDDLETDYWDDFLVRNVSMVESAESSAMKKHRRADLEAVKLAEDKRKSPFIHDPFIKSQDQGTETLLVAGDENEFHVTLQNPYEFEVEIEMLGLVGEGVEFKAEESDLHLGPFRTQKFSVIGIAQQDGKLTITGCSIKIRGCRLQTFPIFVEPWSPEPSLKIKGIGLEASIPPPVSRPVSNVSTSSEPNLPTTTNDPIPMTLTLTVLPKQPLLTVSSVSLVQSSLMLLEGERKCFRISVKNTSKDTTNDFLHVSFEDTTTTSQRNTMSNKDIPRAELHELEVQVARNPPLRWLQADEKNAANVAPQETTTLDIEVLGKPGLLEGKVQIDYASIGTELTADHFYTRQVSVPINFTVNASIQLHRFDVVSFDRNCTLPVTQPSTFQPLSNLATPSTESCMLLLDYRNAWPTPLTISISVLQSTSPATSIDTTPLTSSDITTVTETIQPGHTSRFAIILPRLYIMHPHAPIPSLNPANQRQFVVSSIQANPALERAAREAFWFREALLSRIRGSWTEEASGRTGAVDVRGIRLTAQMVEALRLDDIDIDMRVLEDAGSGDDQSHIRTDSVTRLAHSKFMVQPHAFVTLRTTLTNRSAHAIHPLLRLQPSLANVPHSAALDIAKKFAVSGVMQRALGPVRAGESTSADVGICAMCSGVFEMGATVEEVRPWNEVEGEESRKEVDVLEEGIVGNLGRKIWYSKEGCVIVAKDDEER